MGKKKDKKKYKKRFADAISREIQVIAFCLSIIKDYQDNPSKQDDPEFFSIYAMAMSILAILGVEVNLNPSPDNLDYEL